MEECHLLLLQKHHLDPTEGPVGQVALSFTHHTIQHGPNDDSITATHCNSKEMAINQTKTSLVGKFHLIVAKIPIWTQQRGLSDKLHSVSHITPSNMVQMMILLLQLTAAQGKWPSTKPRHFCQN
jgi:hypothetical protein